MQDCEIQRWVVQDTKSGGKVSRIVMFRWK